MAHHKLFPAASTPENSGKEHDYKSEIIKVIQSYIQKRKAVKPNSKGITRAEKLMTHINSVLIDSEQLTELQLMWRLFEYVRRSRGAGPLETSNVLRRDLRIYLCMALGITDEMIAKVEKRNRGDALFYSNVPPQIGLAQAFRRLSDEVTNELICTALFQLSYERYRTRPLKESELVAKLLKAVNELIAASSTNILAQLLNETRIDRAKSFQSKLNIEWYRVCRFSDYQLMCLLSEHISMPFEFSYGVFGDSSMLRLIVLRVLCEHLEMDEVKIHEMIRQEAQMPLPRQGLDGVVPRFELEAYADTELRVRAKLVKNMLSVDSPSQFVELTQQDVDSMELRNLLAGFKP
jgi:hypothetical protein